MEPPAFDRWHTVSRHLDEALGLPAEQHAAYVTALRADDPVLAEELAALLDEYRAVAEECFLEDGVEVPVARPSIAGQRVGAYTIVSPIGSGGMGTVWLAARSDGRFERRAAVKFLGVALSGHADERFRREGAILARLTHPHIAQLLDAGVSDTGHPYLILEHVDGEPIDRYCERLNLDVEARILLFLDVLSAVSHAHANLIVHRDLKPSNVLVRADGTVKLLDFGIAKLLEDQGREAVATRLTLDGGHALTPAYAAPEQIEGGPITTATDVYSLGVMLYELLTGQHPAGQALRSAVDLLKAIVEVDAPRMSQTAAGERRRRSIRGDLDTIVAKALKKIPADRYASVTAMADDLRRYLQHEPISARPDSAAYRAAKFVRRHRLAVGAAALTVAALSVGLYVVNRERAIAQRRFTEVRQLANKLFDIDAQVRQLPGNSRTRQLIVDTALDYLTRLAVDAGADPDLALDVGTAYMRVARVQGVPISANLGQFDQAERTLQIAQRLIDSVLAARPGNRTALLRSAQIAHDRMVLAGLKRPDEDALRFARLSAERLEQYLGSGAVDPAEAQQIVIAYMNVANRYMLANELDEAIDKARRTIEIARANNEPLQAGAALMVVASALRAKGDLDEALARIRESVWVLQPPDGDHSLGRLNAYTLALTREAAILAEVHGVSLGRPGDAVPLLDRAGRLLSDAAHQDPTNADSRIRLSSVYQQSADILRETNPARALQEYDENLERLAEIKNNSKVQRDEVRSLAGSAVVLERMGRHAEAHKRLSKAFDLLAGLKMYPASVVALGSEPDEALRASADIESQAGRSAEAVKILQTLLDLILAGKPNVETNLSNAADLSGLLAQIAAAARAAGQSEVASSSDRRRQDLWHQWERRLPGNGFVRRQLAALTHEGAQRRPAVRKSSLP